MSSAHRGDDEQGYEVGRGAPGRRKIVALILGVIVAVFVVLLLIWLLGNGNDSVDGAPGGAVPTVVEGTGAL